MDIKQFNTYIVRRMRAEAALSMLEEKNEQYVEVTFNSLVNKKRPTKKQSKEMDVLGSKMNSLKTNISFFSEQIGSSDIIQLEKFRSN